MKNNKSKKLFPIKAKRKALPIKIKRALQEEAGFRCAIATCRRDTPLDFAHINPIENGGSDDFSNLLVLCKNCHGRYHKEHEKFMTLKSMINIKKNLMVMSGRYNSFEIRLMESFLNNPEKEVSEFLFARELDVAYLVKL